MSGNLLSNLLNKIVSDNTSGSRELLNKIHNFVSDNRDKIDEGLILDLKEKLSEFQSVQDYLTKLQQAFKSNSVDAFIEKFNFRSQNIFENIFVNLNENIEQINSFITISNSKTIFEVFKLIQKNKGKLRVIVSEGRPNFEGKVLAEKLYENNINVSLITEAQIYDAVQKVECAIIGADKILPNGNVVNKVGSNLIALACDKFSKPFYVIADKSKVSRDNSFEKIKKPADEIYNAGNKNIEVENYYFEEISKTLITKVITD